MWTKTKLCAILLISVSLCLFLPCAGICSPNPTYQISESELTALEQHLNALTKSQAELTKLKAELKQAKNDAESARKSLKTANEELRKAALSFKQYEAARDRTENRLRNQRTIWEVLFFVAAGVAVAR